MPNLKFLAQTFPEKWRGSQNSKRRSCGPFRTTFDLIYHFLSLVPRWSICMPNLKFLYQTLPEIWRGSQNYKSRSRDPLSTPFDLILQFYCYFPRCSICTPNLKFISQTVPEIWRGPKIPKVGHVTFSRPLSINLSF